MDADEVDWCAGEPVDEDSALERILRERGREMAREMARREMFDPPLPGCLICGVVLCRVPDSDVKYASFLEWWFAVGRKAPKLTAEDWGMVSGPHVGRGGSDVIPKEDWEVLEENEREAIRRWAEKIPIVTFFD